MKFKRREVDECLDKAILCKESRWKHNIFGDDQDDQDGTYTFEGLNVGNCGVNDTVPGCSCQ